MDKLSLADRMLLEAGFQPISIKRDRKRPENTDGGPGSGNHGHKGVPGQVGGSAPSDSSVANGERKAESLQNPAIKSKAYTEKMEQFKKAKDKAMNLEKQAKDVPFYLPESEWDEFDRELVREVGRQYAPHNPEWSKIHNAIDKAEKDADKAIKQANRILLDAEPAPHQGDFGTPKIASGDYQGFLTGDTGTGLDTSQARLVEMAPEEYLARCAAMFNDTAGRETNLTMQIRGLEQENVHKYAELMKQGKKFPTPWLDESGKNGQEGRHRAAAAFEAGIDRIPVFLFSGAEKFSHSDEDDIDWVTINGARKFSDGLEVIKDYLAEETDNEDGGPGSGNWGHEGRPGKIGGSAEGGGSHNRIGDKKKGFTSFSKSKKKFATPHKSDWDEYYNCPEGSIVIDSKGGKWKKIEYNDFVNQDTGEVMGSLILANENDGKDVRILVPDESNPNFKKMKVRDDDRFSAKRKQAAFYTSESEEADKVFREQTGRVWQELEYEDRDALNAYTGSSYKNINGFLRGKEEAYGETEDRIKRITKAIDKCELQQDTYLFRGVSPEALASMMGIDPSKLNKITIARYVGVEISDNAFMSCSPAEGKGFDSSGVYMKIYCPKGTKAMYAEPFSQYGEGNGLDWDGISKQKYFSSEFETILQRGTRMQITGAKENEYGNYEIECQVLAQEYE